MNKDNIAIEFAKTVQALRNLAPTETETSIADIPTHPALEAHRQGKTIRHAQLIEQLTKFRADIEAEAETGLMDIETNLGLALADIALALGIHEPEDMLQILGPDTYLAVYWDPIPYQPKASLHNKALHLLAKLYDTWTARRGGEAQPEPSHVR